jgi:hypothetical protein
MICYSNLDEHSFIGFLKRGRTFGFYLLFFWVFSMPFVVSAQSADETADALEMPNRAIGLTPEENALVQKGLQLLPKTTYAYVVIHGDGGFFKIFENNRWEIMAPNSLARWLANNQSYHNKTIVLLSCSNTSSTQALSNALAKLDTTANPRREIRPVIG